MNKTTLRSLRDSLHADQPIDLLQWVQLIRIIDTVLEGYDVRKQYGIKTKPGAPPSTRSLRKWMALHFLALCADDPNTDPKVHRRTVGIAGIAGL